MIGSPGAGKSTFARALAERTGLPLSHLDAEYWLPGWTAPAPNQWRSKLAQLTSGERWVIDGNYGGSLDMRLKRADTVIYLDFPTLLCLWRALSRMVILRGQVRDDTAPGCPERIDLPFLAYIASFRSRKRARYHRRLQRFRVRTLVFKSPAQAAQWLDSLPRLAA